MNTVRTFDGFLTTCPRIPSTVISTFSLSCRAGVGFRAESDKFLQRSDRPFCPKTNPESFSVRLCNRVANKKIGGIDFSMKYLVFDQVILRDSTI